jgi:hypothetical protein
LKKSLQKIIELSDLSQENRVIALQNWMKVFPPKANHLLEKLVEDYPRLIQALPLQPKTCYKRFSVWEENLFKKLDEQKAKAIREKKAFEISKLATEQEILDEVARIFSLMERQKVEEEQMKQDKAKHRALGSIVNELKSLFVEQEKEFHMVQAQKELEVMEEGSIEEELQIF